MSDKTLASLTAATPATGGLIYGTQGGADRKFTMTAKGAAVMESANGCGLPNLTGLMYIDHDNGNDTTGNGTSSKPFASAQAAWTARGGEASNSIYALLPSATGYSISLPAGSTFSFFAVTPGRAQLSVTVTSDGTVTLKDTDIESVRLTLLRSGTFLNCRFDAYDCDVVAVYIIGGDGDAGVDGNPGATGATGETDQDGGPGGPGGDAGNGGDGTNGGLLFTYGGKLSGALYFSGGNGGPGGTGGAGGSGGDGGPLDGFEFSHGGQGGDGGDGGRGGTGGAAGGLTSYGTRIIGADFVANNGTGGAAGVAGAGGAGGAGNGTDNGPSGEVGMDGLAGDTGSGGNCELNSCLVLATTFSGEYNMTNYLTLFRGGYIGGSVTPEHHATLVDTSFTA